MAGNSNSGRRAVPANVHLIRGNPSKKSATELAHAGQSMQAPIEAPKCPAFLTADAKAEWKRIAEDLVSLRVLSNLDRAELAVYCQAWADWKRAREKIAELGEKGFVENTPSGYKQIAAWMQLANRAEERMRTAGASFGLNPSARSRITPQSPQGELFPNEEKDKAAKYF